MNTQTRSAPPDNGASKMRDPSAAWFWKTDGGAAEEFEALPSVRDDAAMLSWLEESYGLSREMVPRDDWRVFTHPVYGRGIVYRYSFPGCSAGYRFRSLARDESGKRVCRNLFGRYQADLSLQEPRSEELVLVCGEEPGRPFFKCGCDVLTLADDKSTFSVALAKSIVRLNFNCIILAFSAQEGNVTRAARLLVSAGFPAEMIAEFPWADGDKKGRNVNDLLQADGLDEIAVRLENCKPIEIASPKTDEQSEGAADTDPQLLNDDTNARLFVERFSDRVRFVHGLDRWHIWDGKRWAQDDEKTVDRLGIENARHLNVLAAAAKDKNTATAYRRHAKASGDYRRIQSMLATACSDGRVSLRHDQLDCDPNAFNVANGTINLQTGELRPHKREDRLSKLADVHFDGQAKCPLWDSFVLGIMDGDKALADFLRRAVGYSLSADVREKCLFFMYGPHGDNGKSTFIEVLMRLFGDYECKSPADMLLVSRRADFTGPRPDLVRLRGARLVVASEIEEGRHLHESLIKDLTGGDTITARDHYKSFIDFPPTHKLWIYGNHRPVVRGGDDAIWSRLAVIPFNSKFIRPDDPAYESTPPERRADLELRGKLIEELSGILNWALAGCAAWMRDGLTRPAAVKVATARYRSDMDLLGQFIEEVCVISADAFVPSQELHAAYTTWAKRNGEEPLSQRGFSNKLQEHVADLTPNKSKKINGKNQRCWLGIGLLSEVTVTQGNAVLHKVPYARARGCTDFTENGSPTLPNVTPSDRVEPSAPAITDFAGEFEEI